MAKCCQKRCLADWQMPLKSATQKPKEYFIVRCGVKDSVKGVIKKFKIQKIGFQLKNAK